MGKAFGVGRVPRKAEGALSLLGCGGRRVLVLVPQLYVTLGFGVTHLLVHTAQQYDLINTPPSTSPSSPPLLPGPFPLFY